MSNVDPEWEEHVREEAKKAAEAARKAEEERQAAAERNEN